MKLLHLWRLEIAVAPHTYVRTYTYLLTFAITFLSRPIWIVLEKRVAVECRNQPHAAAAGRVVAEPKPVYNYSQGLHFNLLLCRCCRGTVPPRPSRRYSVRCSAMRRTCTCINRYFTLWINRKWTRADKKKACILQKVLNIRCTYVFLSMVNVLSHLYLLLYFELNFSGSENPFFPYLNSNVNGSRVHYWRHTCMFLERY